MSWKSFIDGSYPLLFTGKPHPSVAFLGFHIVMTYVLVLLCYLLTIVVFLEGPNCISWVPLFISFYPLKFELSLDSHSHIQKRTCTELTIHLTYELRGNNVDVILFGNSVMCPCLDIPFSCIIIIKSCYLVP